MTQYSATTRGVRIQVTPVFLDDQSDPEENDFMWAYTVEIANMSEQTVQLTARTWKIIDHHGVTQVVQGPGVVGEQPILREGDSLHLHLRLPPFDALWLDDGQLPDADRQWRNLRSPSPRLLTRQPV